MSYKEYIKKRGIYMKKKNIAMLMAMTMITSGVTGSMEAVYASDEVQIQSMRGNIFCPIREHICEFFLCIRIFFADFDFFVPGLLCIPGALYLFGFRHIRHFGF